MTAGKVGKSVEELVDIVASAVQGMEPDRVTVTDNNGRLLNSGSQSSSAARSRKEYVKVCGCLSAGWSGRGSDRALP